jgi:hypothetical protein
MGNSLPPPPPSRMLTFDYLLLVLGQLQDGAGVVPRGAPHGGF